MGRFREASRDDGGEAGIDISPLMDCVFILLIFFIVTTTFVEESGFEVDRPQQVPQASSSENTSVVLVLSADGQVTHNGDKIGVAGVVKTVQDGLRGNPDAPVIVQADKQAPAGLLVRVIDEARSAGATKVSLANAQ
jgi:biopolymer transport protein ExbD